MKSIAAGKFKDRCLKTLDEIASTRTVLVITKRGKPVAKLIPYVAPGTTRSLASSFVTSVAPRCRAPVSRMRPTLKLSKICRDNCATETPLAATRAASWNDRADMGPCREPPVSVARPCRR